MADYDPKEIVKDEKDYTDEDTLFPEEDANYFSLEVLAKDKVIDSSPESPLEPSRGKTEAEIHAEREALSRDIGELEKVKTIRKQDEETEDLTNVSVLSEPPLGVNEDLLGELSDIDKKDIYIKDFLKKSNPDLQLKEGSLNSLRSKLKLEGDDIYFVDGKTRIKVGNKISGPLAKSTVKGKTGG